ncbi:MAG: endo alpha-1,4 polygalactosaminidase [Planctomycetota bacterium]
MTYPTRFILTATLVAMTTTAHANPPTAAPPEMATIDGPVPVRHWGYQLQGGASAEGLLPGPLSAVPHDLIVIDHARFGDAASRFTLAEVAAMKTRADGSDERRVVAAYLSIGEASEFRSFWDAQWTADGSADSPLRDGAPRYLGPVNPNWPESRKVRYWDPDWQDILFNQANTGWLDAIVAQGFDAAYLDIVDAYYFWGQTVPPEERQDGDPRDGQDAARRMIDLVVALTTHARQTNPRFFVIPQNGAFILNDADYAGPLAQDPARRAAYLDALGAIGVEDVYCGGDLDQDNPFDPDQDTIAVLQKDFLAQGKPVLAVDYLTEAAIADRFVAAAVRDGFLPYVAPSRGLDVMAPPVVTAKPASRP